MNSTTFLVNCTTIFVILSVPPGPDVSPILRRRPAAEPLEGALKCSSVTKPHLTGSLIDREVLGPQQPSRFGYPDEPNPVCEMDVDLSLKVRREVFVFAACHLSCILRRQSLVQMLFEISLDLVQAGVIGERLPYDPLDPLLLNGCAWKLFHVPAVHEPSRHCLHASRHVTE